jgi:hypothetical protein
VNLMRLYRKEGQVVMEGFRVLSLVADLCERATDSQLSILASIAQDYYHNTHFYSYLMTIAWKL